MLDFVVNLHCHDLSTSVCVCVYIYIFIFFIVLWNSKFLNWSILKKYSSFHYFPNSALWYIGAPWEMSSVSEIKYIWEIETVEKFICFIADTEVKLLKMWNSVLKIAIFLKSFKVIFPQATINNYRLFSIKQLNYVQQHWCWRFFVFVFVFFRITVLICLPDWLYLILIILGVCP